jgi:hypothetical protein
MAEQLACTTYSFPKTPSAPRFTTPAGGKPSPKLRLIHNAKPKKKIILRIPSPFSSSGSSSPTPSNSPEKKNPSPEPQPAKVVEHRLTSPGKITKETPSPVSTPKKTVEDRFTSPSKITRKTPSPVPATVIEHRLTSPAKITKNTPSPVPPPKKTTKNRLTSPSKITRKTPSPVSQTFPKTHTSAASPKPPGREFKLFTFPEPEWMKDGLTWEQRITAMKQRKYHLDRNYLAVPPKSNNFRPEQLDFKSLGTEHLKPPFARFWEKA